jgi:hypothetical protein
VVARIEVEVAGASGLDDSADLLAELVRETGLDWHEERVPEGRHLSGGAAEILLTAAVSGAAGKAGEFAYQKGADLVRAVVARWSARYLDPPEVRVGVTETPGAPDTEQGTPDTPAPGEAAGAQASAPSPAAAPDHRLGS